MRSWPPASALSRWPRSSRAPGALALGLCLLAPAVAAGVRFEVGGSVSPRPDALEVEVRLTNAGDTPAARVSLEAELMGSRVRAELPEGVAPGVSASIPLRFPPEVPRPGVHPVLLLIEYPAEAAGGEAAISSQRAYLLLALGGNPKPAVKLEVPEARMGSYGRLRVGLESADRAPHRVNLRTATPRGFRARDPSGEIEVPAEGRVTLEVPLLRSGAPRGSVQGLLVVASASDGPEERTSVAAGQVQVLEDSRWMPWLRTPFVVAALLLGIAAGVSEWRRHRARPAA